MGHFKWKREFGTTTSADFFRLMCDEHIGDGAARSVYGLGWDKQHVVKFERHAGRFQNVIEREVWEHVMGTVHENLFAPVEFISANGIVLIMKRTQPITAAQFPDEIPKFFRDIKVENFGMLDGRVVCHDYGTGINFNFSPGKRKVNKNLEENRVWQ